MSEKNLQLVKSPGRNGLEQTLSKANRHFRLFQQITEDVQNSLDLEKDLNKKSLALHSPAQKTESISEKIAQSSIQQSTFITKIDKRGTGLGLLMTKLIVNNHQGHLEIDSQLGKGTTAKVILLCLEGGF